ncbi:MAG: DUF5309 family protein [Lentisphaeria bacterium]|nr:DUF5309 family protein [Lentisphaeria bacterium]
MLFSYSFQNKKRDLAEVLSTVIKNEPRFISNFKMVENATQQKHEWLEDQITGRSVTASSITEAGVMTVSAGDIEKIKVGSLLTRVGDSALLRVDAVNNGVLNISIVSANGSATTLSTLGDNVPAVFNIVSTPVAEGSIIGDETGLTGKTNYNCTQIFRKDIILSGSALAVNVFGNVDNLLNRQTGFALEELARDLNRVALFGRRVEASAVNKGEAGGLYYFGCGEGAMEIDANGTTVDSFSLNDAAQAILSEGGEPMQILCSVGQARVLSNEYRNNLQILRADECRGAYVAQIVNEINGRAMTIMADPDMVDTDVWVIDTAGFGLSALSGRAINDRDATPNGFDGIKRMALGELTFEFKNAKQRLCRIKNLMPSTAAIAAMKN